MAYNQLNIRNDVHKKELAKLCATLLVIYCATLRSGLSFEVVLSFGIWTFARKMTSFRFPEKVFVLWG